MNNSRRILHGLVFFVLALFWLSSCAKLAPPQPPDNIPDTTSHSFRWHIDNIGDGLGNELFDVVVVNDSLAYAVGSLYLNDSLGNFDPVLYNYATWNGITWTVRRLYYHFQNYYYQSDSALGPIYSVFALSENDIWFGFGNLVHWDGHSFQSFAIPPEITPPPPNRIWGTSDKDLYLGGLDGRIVHFDGATWQLLQTGTNLEVFDIWGAKNPATGQYQVLAVASDGVNKNVLSIQGTSIGQVPDTGLPGFARGIWFVPNQKYYVVGSGIGQIDRLGDSPWVVYQPGVVTSFGSACIRGNAVNDIFVVGSYLEIVHFNGMSWYNYKTEIPNGNGVWARVSIKGNLVIAVGSAQQAIAAIGRR